MTIELHGSNIVRNNMELTREQLREIFELHEIDNIEERLNQLERYLLLNAGDKFILVITPTEGSDPEAIATMHSIFTEHEVLCIILPYGTGINVNMITPRSWKNGFMKYINKLKEVFQ